MRIGSFIKDCLCRLGVFEEHTVIDANGAYQSYLADKNAPNPDLQARVELPPDLVLLLNNGQAGLKALGLAVDHAAANKDRRPAYIIPLSEVKFAAPHRPPKIVCTGTNYEDYRKMIGIDFSPVPLVFLKSPSAVIGHEQTIYIPQGYGVIYHEWEFSCVIGQRCKNVPRDRVSEVIFGYTIFNDMTGRSLEAVNREFQPWGKNIDTFAPFGPWVVTAEAMPQDLYNLRTIRRRNGKVECESNTSNMNFGFADIISFVSTFMTLEPGDVVTTATPPAGPVAAGDIIEAEIEGIGVLRNPVEAIATDSSFADLINLDQNAV